MDQISSRIDSAEENIFAPEDITIGNTQSETQK